MYLTGYEGISSLHLEKDIRENTQGRNFILMALISIQNVTLAFGGPPLFDGIHLSVERGEKVALMGRNGSGKSTLLNLIEGSIKPDSGTVLLRKGARAALLPQEVPREIDGTVFDVIAGGLKEHSDLVTEYHDVSRELSKETSPALSDKLDRVHNSLEAEGGWEIQQKVDKIISLLGLDADLVFNTLSAGRKRQVMLGRTLPGEPEILLLDEPTNHMDIDSIKRLEELLIRYSGTLVFVTHDRMFLQHIANRIVEIDRGTLFDQSCDYETFLARRQAAREVEDVGHALFDKKLEKEERWIRQGVKARRTRNEGRVRELEKMREMRRSRRERPGMVKMEVGETERSGRLVMKLKDVSFAYGDTLLISHFSTSIMKGDRVGILGPNGCGKTTLLEILLGELSPLSGSVRMGTDIRYSYFDQLREQLDCTKSVRENAGGGKDVVTVNGKDRHVMGYLADFLFSADRAVEPVSHLSGGERNRLLLARMFARPSNLLVLDEPTNDLDLETLELFEDFLVNYSGTILLVSHDRTFINNVVTSTIVFESPGVVKEYVGGYDDWLRQRPEAKSREKKNAPKREAPRGPALRTKRKFGYNQQKELDSLPHAIELLEEEQAELFQEMSDPQFYKRDRSEIVTKTERLESLKEMLQGAYDRWEELEELKNSHP